MQTTHNPPEGYEPSPKTRTAWCPYCGAAKEFIHDPALDTCRCSGCGISTEDFYVRGHNGFWNEDAKRKFDSAVKAFGKKWSREKKKDAWEPRDPGITWELPEEKTEFHPAACPACGESIRLAVFPLKDERCHRCGAVFSQEKPDGEAEIHVKTLSCRACGRLLTDRPEPGAAYGCPSCGKWTAQEGDWESEKAARETAKTLKPFKVERKGPLPFKALEEIRKLVREECANYESRGDSCLFKGTCVFFKTPKAEERPFLFKGGPGKPEVKRWSLTEETEALYTTSLGLANAGLEMEGAELMATYAKNGVIYAAQFSGPKEAIAKLAALGKTNLVLAHPANETGEPVQDKPPAPHRCRWFEEAVLPLKPELAEPYRREYKGETKKELKEEAKEALLEAKKENLKKCAREGCGKFFRPANNRALYCEDCRKLLERERKRKWWNETQNKKNQQGVC